MVHVRLEKEWTDGRGATHAAGETVDVDPATLAQLQKDGVVRETEGFHGPDGAETERWIGPTGTTT